MTWSKKVSWEAWLIVGLVLLVLAGIAIPNIIRARQTPALNSVANNLRIIEGAKEQWALENRKVPTDLVSLTDLTAYFKNNTVPVSWVGEVYAVTTVGALCTATLAVGATINDSRGQFTITSF